MPNWVTNRLTISGDGDRVDALTGQLHPEESPGIVRFRLETGDGVEWLNISFQEIVPRPASVDATSRDGNVKLGLAVLSTPTEDWIRAYDGVDPFAEGVPEKYVDTRTRILERHGLAGLEGDALRKAALKVDPDCLAAGQAALAAYGETGHFGWYYWGLANWGVRSEPEEGRFELHPDGAISLRFTTADRAPLAFFEAVAKAYPDLMFNGGSIDEDNGYSVSFVTDEPGKLIISQGDDEDLDDAYKAVYGHARETEDEEPEDEDLDDDAEIDNDDEPRF